jgi:hypothetical protein
MRVGPKTTRRNPFMSRVRQTWLIALLMVGAFSEAVLAGEVDELPRLPCQTEAPFPAFPATTATQNVSTWSMTTAAPRWVPPSCTGWAPSNDHGYRTMVALSARIELSAGQDASELLRRMGALSSLKDARYWSVTDQQWRPLVTDIWAVDNSEPRQQRADFTATELASKRDVYFVQHDSRSTTGVVYRMRVRENGPDRLVVQTENVSRIRLLLMTLFQPEALQTVHFFQRISPTIWGYYSLSRATEKGTSSLVDGHAASYVNRAVAYYRFLAGIPTDRDPPLAP